MSTRSTLRVLSMIWITVAASSCSGPGEAGADGSSCTVSTDQRGVVTIACDDGTSATLPPPADGSSCSVVDNRNGTRTISCDDGTSVIVSDGRNGTDGQDGTAGVDGTDGVNGNDGVDGRDGRDGQNGTSCTVTDHQNGTRTIACDDGTSAVITDGRDGQDGTDGGSCTVTDHGDGTVTLSCEDGTSVTWSLSEAPITLSLGLYHTCITNPQRVIKCWGASNFATNNVLPGPFDRLMMGATIDSYGCGFRPDGVLRCWGGNSWPTPIADSRPYLDVALARDFMCFLQEDRTVRCQGLAPPTPSGEFTAIAVTSNLQEPLRVGCGIRPDQTLHCWTDYDPYEVALPPAGHFTALGITLEFGCGLRTDQTVTCWGTSAPPAPTGTYRQLSVGYQHACALSAVDDTVVCWGNNGSGRTNVPAGAYRTVAAGGFHSCAVTTNEKIVCWGADLWGASTPPIDLW
jgi:hypothetical protein